MVALSPETITQKKSKQALGGKGEVQGELQQGCVSRVADSFSGALLERAYLQSQKSWIPVLPLYVVALRLWQNDEVL